MDCRSRFDCRAKNLIVSSSLCSSQKSALQKTHTYLEHIKSLQNKQLISFPRKPNNA
jgi:hypothetical protein